MAKDPRYIILRDICNGGIKERYSKEVMEKKDEILDFFERKQLVKRTDEGYSCTPFGKECLVKLGEQMWYSAMENVLSS